jgi:hypothetical protein
MLVELEGLGSGIMYNPRKDIIYNRKMMGFQLAQTDILFF